MAWMLEIRLYRFVTPLFATPQLPPSGEFLLSTPKPRSGQCRINHLNEPASPKETKAVTVNDKLRRGISQFLAAYHKYTGGIYNAVRYPSRVEKAVNNAYEQ